MHVVIIFLSVTIVVILPNGIRVLNFQRSRSYTSFKDLETTLNGHGEIFVTKNRPATTLFISSSCDILLSGTHHAMSPTWRTALVVTTLLVATARQNFVFAGSCANLNVGFDIDSSDLVRRGVVQQDFALGAPETAANSLGSDSDKTYLCTS